MPGSRLNHTMIRVKDIKASLKFYVDILGMELLDESPGSDFCNYFLAFPIEGQTLTKEEKKSTKLSREGVLELCFNFGTDTDPEFKGYANGNDGEGRGFGHLAISVDDVQVECDRLVAAGVSFKKLPHEGRMKHIAFCYDPDRYWVEIVPNKSF